MELRLALAALLAAALLAGQAAASEEGGKLVVAVTLPGLDSDVALMCRGSVEVFSVAPPGADPHEYNLRPSDVAALKRADVIVTTLHAPFELRIDELVKSGELSPRAYVVVQEAPGVELLTNPATGQPNLHFPIYDPKNYAAFARFLGQLLASLDPSAAACAAGAEELAKRAEEAAESASKNPPVKAVGSSPLVQYAVSFLNVELVALLSAEPDMPPSPQSVLSALSLLKSGGAKLAVVSGELSGAGVAPYTQSDRALLELARSAGAPVLVVPPPTSPGSAIEKIEAVLKSYEELASFGAAREGGAGAKLATAAGAAAGAAALLLLAWRRWR